MRTGNPAWMFFFLALSLAVSACRGPERPTASQQNLKAALLALDRGDETLAEEKLQASLREDRGNTKARTALASLYAKRASILLKDWLDPLMEAGNQLGTKMRAYRSSYDVLLSAGGGEGPRAVSGAPLSDSELEVRRRIQQYHGYLGQVAVGTMIAMDLFHNVPYLDKPAFRENIDKAIQVLREENANPELRSEDVKVYLAVLGLVRFIHYSRNFVGSFDHEAREIFTRRSKFCQADAREVREKVLQIRDSLLVVEEGLRISEAAADNRHRRSRLRLYRFVKKFLLGSDWAEVEKFFESGSEANQSAMRLFRYFCGIAGTSVSQTDRGKDYEGGANLFDPDAD